MARKEQKKPSKKPHSKGAAKPKRASGRAKKAAAPAKKVTKAAAPLKKAASQAKKPVSSTKKAAPQAEKAAVAETKAPAQPAKSAKFFSVAEFSAMTYLTEYGVMQWLKEGRLKGQQDEQGVWQVDAANLGVPNVKRLVR